MTPRSWRAGFVLACGFCGASLGGTLSITMIVACNAAEISTLKNLFSEPDAFGPATVSRFLLTVMPMCASFPPMPVNGNG